jgi:hypothetical protein
MQYVLIGAGILASTIISYFVTDSNVQVEKQDTEQEKEKTKQIQKQPYNSVFTIALIGTIIYLLRK